MSTASLGPDLPTANRTLRRVAGAANGVDGLYTAAERQRRDQSPWTIVQAVLAPVQFAVFLVSLALVLRSLVVHEGYQLADASILVKTVVLYTIMVTGAIWEKAVFGRYLFARAFFVEDATSMVVIALHTLAVLMIFGQWATPEARLSVALAGYATYVLNAGQFVLKLRAARRQEQAAAVLRKAIP